MKAKLRHSSFKIHSPIYSLNLFRKYLLSNGFQTAGDPVENETDTVPAAGETSSDEEGRREIDQ